jgi:hypothetical protein
MDNNDSLKDLYTTPEDRIDTILDRSDVAFWRALRKLKSQLDLGGLVFQDFLLEEYGIKLTMTSNENGHEGYVPKAEIVDEQKYLMFLLKYQS